MKAIIITEDGREIALDCYPEPATGQLALLAELKQPAPVPAETLASFGDSEEVAIKCAIAWAWRERRVRAMSGRRGAELMGMKHSHFSNMLAGKKYLPVQKINAFESIVGNTAVTQTIERFRTARDARREQKVAELVAEHLNKVA